MKKVVHFEIPVDDLERAKSFYSIFDWQMTDYPMPDGSTFTGCRTVPVNESTYVPTEPGAINGGMVLRTDVCATPQFTIHVPSVDEYINKVLEAGGTVVKGKEIMGGTGYYAYLKDSEGNLFSLWEDILQG